MPKKHKRRQKRRVVKPTKVMIRRDAQPIAPSKPPHYTDTSYLDKY